VDSHEPKRVPAHRGFRTLKNASFLRPFRGAAARRAIGEIEKDRKGWVRHGIAALAISGLGLGVAGAVAMTGSASQATQGSAPGVTVSSSSSAQNNTTGTGDPQFGTRTEGTSRTSERQSLTEDGEKSPAQGEPLDGTVDMTALRDAQKNADVTDTSSEDADAAKAAERRAKALQSSSAETEELSEKLSREERERRQEAIREAEKAAAEARAQAESQQSGGYSSDDSTTTDTGTTGTGDTGSDSGDEPVSTSPGDGKATMPLKSYSIAAHFGQVGSWSRYHTGVDFSAPIGTPIYATGNGVVTNAGSGSASSWAGNYVTIKFSNGQQMLFAHMGSVSVSVGQQVSGGQMVGHVGMTGRTFGPHCHVELYPAGVTPGDVYRAVDPMTWFNAHGL
jgi:murein DD-endopeptidase MepM/ murein hydrolase activator NlpD